MKTILITGGAVHGKLDAVKLVTNRFRGGMMAEIAELLSLHFDVTYLTAKGMSHPNLTHGHLLFHDGFHDYMQKVLELAPTMNGILLGAAVANLIPQSPFPGKFPSHQYKPGDIINIPFVIAPRVIDQVHRVAPKTHLFGFKLLSGVAKEVLVDAAYGVLLDSKAELVFANDATNLAAKFAITKERGVIPLDIDGLVQMVKQAMEDEYYSSVSCVDLSIGDVTLFNKLVLENQFNFMAHNGFGTVAVRAGPGKSFFTTQRNKIMNGQFVNIPILVYAVSHDTRQVIYQGTSKPTLNAPLLAHIFETNPTVTHIIHLHEQVPNLPTLPYAPPATVRDSIRDVHSSFNIEHHGCYLFNGVRE